MRIPLIAGNWKMNNNIDQSLKLVDELLKLSENFDQNVEILVCVPFTSLYSIKKKIEGTIIKMGAQNMHYEEKGAYTGEISPGMLKDAGALYVIVGHSERRQFFCETDETVNKKLKAALKFDLKPILCVGETLEQRESDKEKSIVRNQLMRGLEGINLENILKIVIAYEPIWAIGTGKTATNDEANQMASFIRQTLSEIYSEEIAQKILILYGGSVKGENASEIMQQSDIDGALVGGASLNADEFMKIIKFADTIE